MIYKPTPYPIRGPVISVANRPMIKIKLFNRLRSIETLALIDSGADTCLINTSWAEALLYDDYKKGEIIGTVGISGNPQNVYYHDLEYEVSDVPGHKFTIPFGFVSGMNASILLGRLGFFDKYIINFDFKNNMFEVKI